MRLELGSGYHPTPGFTHLDLNPNAPEVDIVGPAYPLDLPDASCEEIRAVDVLEHLSYRVTLDVLREWVRVLVPAGRLYVQVPDAEEAVKRYLSNDQTGWDRVPRDCLSGLGGPWPMRVLEWVLMGGHADGDNVREGDDWRWNAHYALFSRWSLSGLLHDAGFRVESLETNAHPNLLCWAVKR